MHDAEPTPAVLAERIEGLKEAHTADTTRIVTQLSRIETRLDDVANDVARLNGSVAGAVVSATAAAVNRQRETSANGTIIAQGIGLVGQLLTENKRLLGVIVALILTGLSTMPWWPGHCFQGMPTAAVTASAAPSAPTVPAPKETGP